MLYKESFIPALIKTFKMIPNKKRTIAGQTANIARRTTSILSRVARPVTKATMTAAKIPYGAGKILGTQLVKRPKTVLGTIGVGLLTKDNIQKNLQRSNPSYIVNNKINV